MYVAQFQGLPFLDLDDLANELTALSEEVENLVVNRVDFFAKFLEVHNWFHGSQQVRAADADLEVACTHHFPIPVGPCRRRGPGSGRRVPLPYPSRSVSPTRTWKWQTCTTSRSVPAERTYLGAQNQRASRGSR